MFALTLTLQKEKSGRELKASIQSRLRSSCDWCSRNEEITAIHEGRFDESAPQEIALLRMADAMADTPSNVSDELYAELRHYLSEEQLIELAASAAQENFRARYNRVFDVGSDGLYRKGLPFKERQAAWMRRKFRRQEISSDSPLAHLP